MGLKNQFEYTIKELQRAQICMEEGLEVFHKSDYSDVDQGYIVSDNFTAAHSILSELINLFGEDE